MASLPPGLARWLRSNAMEVWADGFEKLVSVRWPEMSDITDRQRADIEAALAGLDDLLEPARPEEVAAELTRLRLVTKARATGDDDMAAVLAVLADELMEFPVAAVRDACRQWARRETFFPSLSELRAACQDTTRHARAMREFLRAQGATGA